MRLLLNWIIQLYEILKQFIIVLEGITVINFVYNTFIKEKLEDEQLTAQLNYKLRNEQQITQNLRCELLKEKSKLKDEQQITQNLKYELLKEKSKLKELLAKVNNLQVHNSNLRKALKVLYKI